MKICKDCRHYQPDGANGLHGGSRCRREVDLVEGQPVFCDSSRRCDSRINAPCGRDAEHFEPFVGVPPQLVRIVCSDEPRPWWRFWE